MKSNYIDLDDWMQRHPRLTTLVKYSPDNPKIVKIIAESNNSKAIRIQYNCMDDKEYNKNSTAGALILGTISAISSNYISFFHAS